MIRSLISRPLIVSAGYSSINVMVATKGNGAGCASVSSIDALGGVKGTPKSSQCTYGNANSKQSSSETCCG